MEIVLVIMLWELSLIFAFELGRRARCKKRTAVKPQPSDKELIEKRRAQKELENFMSYDGREQEAISD